MLDPKKNRLDYGTLLMPPEGFTLTHAVADYLFAGFVHFAGHTGGPFLCQGVLDGRFEDNRFDVLESIQKTADILTVYCQKGKIKVPGKFNWLFCLFGRGHS